MVTGIAIWLVQLWLLSSLGYCDLKEILEQLPWVTASTVYLCVTVCQALYQTNPFSPYNNRGVEMLSTLP